MAQAQKHPGSDPADRSPPPLLEQQQARPSWLLPALGLLVALALLVVFWLPGQVTPTAPSGDVESTPVATTPAASPSRAPAEAAASPFGDAQAARLRKEAQEVLAQFLDLQFALEERGAPRWAAPAFEAAVATAEAGDELYRQREYEAATTRYREGVAQLEAIEAGIEYTLVAQLRTTTEAIEAGDGEVAAEALELAALIQPDHPELAALQSRLAALPSVQALLASATEAEANGDLAAAEAALREATGLDGAHRRAADELARVAAAYRELRFNTAMSAGYQALDAGQFTEADRQFRAAAALRDDTGEATAALAEVAAARQLSQLSQWKRQGEQAERAEQWSQAVAAYDKALASDPNIAFAVEGRQRAAPRARLDRQLEETIARPERLQDPAVAEAASALLGEARLINGPGTRLASQLTTLERLLERANTPLAVSLQSDGQTEVLVYRVARLGRFTNTSLELRPGTYTLRGSRDGYRDVLETITIDDNNTGPFTIACREPIR